MWSHISNARGPQGICRVGRLWLEQTFCWFVQLAGRGSRTLLRHMGAVPLLPPSLIVQAPRFSLRRHNLPAGSPTETTLKILRPPPHPDASRVHLKSVLASSQFWGVNDFRSKTTCLQCAAPRAFQFNPSGRALSFMRRRGDRVPSWREGGTAQGGCIVRNSPGAT